MTCGARRSTRFKRSAVHNLRVTRVRPAGDGVDEGLVVPRAVLELADIEPFEEILVTRVGGDSWTNRVPSFALPGHDGVVEARGSLARFLAEADLICLITWSVLDASGREAVSAGELPLLDVGFDPADANDARRARLHLERGDARALAPALARDVRDRREKWAPRSFLSALVTGLRVTETHPDCLQGSAEIPGEVMEFAGLTRHQAVSVSNATRGGSAETYVVPMPSGVVMTTGAMAGFAPVGSVAHVAVYEGALHEPAPRIVRVEENRACTLVPPRE